MLKNKKIAFQLSFFILTFTIIIFIAIFAYDYNVSKTLLLKNVEISARHLTYSAANKIEGFLMAVQKIPHNFACMLENSIYNEEELKSMLSSLVADNPEIYGGCVAFEPGAFDPAATHYALYSSKNKSGEVVINRIGGSSYDYFFMDWYQIPQRLGRAVWTEPYYDTGAGNAVMSTYSAPFYIKTSGGKKFGGIVTVDMSLDWLENIMASIKIFDGGYGFLISRFGNIITHPQKNWIMNESIFTIADESNDLYLRRLGRKMIKGESGFYPLSNAMLNKDCWLYFVPLKSSDWSIAVLIPSDELFKDLNTLMNVIIAFALSGIFALFFVITYVSNKVTKPLNELANITKIVGAGNFDVKLPETTSSDEVGILNNSFIQMQKALKEYMLNFELTTRAKEKIQSELKIARDIQMGIIPKIFPPFPDQPDIDIYAILQPAKEVGGDLYDFFFLDDDMICVAIGDVSDKGVPASLFMAITRTLLRAKTAKNMKPGDVLKSMNEALCQDNESAMFVTFFLAMLNLKTGALHYANAGHNPPYFIRKNFKVEEFPAPKDMPLGIIERDYNNFEAKLEKGDSIFLFTDGVNEAISSDGTFYGDKRLAGLLEKAAGHKPRKVIETISRDLAEFTRGADQSDDITITAVKFY